MTLHVLGVTLEDHEVTITPLAAARPVRRTLRQRVWLLCTP